LPKQWEVRFIDENISPAKASDFAWADVVLASGMHVQRRGIREINDRAHRAGKLTVLGGPSVSGCPEYYPDFDILHIGELGDATDELIRYIDLECKRPDRQIRFTTRDRLPLTEFPSPVSPLRSLRPYLLTSIQFSSGCPYTCEFCDIPELYGRNPRLKTPQQIVQELDAILERSPQGAVYFVDDNFIGNRKAAMELLPHLIEWQKKHGYPLEFACEATLNIAGIPKLLEMMREACFYTVFCGIETPEPDALRSIAKSHNLTKPILESVKILNSYGIEVVSGIIMGLDTDTADTGDRILDFIEQSQIPVLTINLLEALPHTPLWRRLEKEGRIIHDEARASNVDFLLPYEQVLGMWYRCMREAYTPESLYRRFANNTENTFRNRLEVPVTSARLNARNIYVALQILTRLIVRVGLLSNYRKTFWRMAIPAFKKGDIEPLIHVGLVSHHLIKFAQECLKGEQGAAFYSEKLAEKPLEKSALSA
jgi:hopanoid C-2 methylase